MNSISISFQTNTFYIIVGIILLLFYAILLYKYTVPPIAKILKSLLIVIRALSLIIILLLIFEPLFINEKTGKIEPVNYVFIDNSSSIIRNDSITTVSSIDNFVNNFQTSISNKTEVFLFGNDVRPLAENESPDYSDKFTNFQKIVSFVKQSEENVASAVIISDGIMNSGTSPESDFAALNIPVFTVGTGDSIKHKDISVKDIISNNLVYEGKKTTLEAILLNNNLQGNIARVELYAENIKIAEQNVSLNASGVTRLNFDYTPENPGENKITIKAIPIAGEITPDNNSKTIFINVLNNKIRVGLITENPSPDFSFIKNSLEADENYSTIPVIHIAPAKLNEYEDNAAKIDSVDILILISYPAKNSDPTLKAKIISSIINQKKPYLLIVTSQTDLAGLRELKDELPFQIEPGNKVINKAQLNIVDQMNPIFQINSKIEIEDFENLPPVPVISSGLAAKPGSNTIAEVKVKNIPTGNPFIISSSVGKSRNISIFGYELWRWKLQNSVENVYDQFIRNIVQWLLVKPDADKFKIKTNKRIYAYGEEVEFIAELYDDKLSPVLDGEIKIEFGNSNTKQEIYLTADQSGIYKGAFQANMLGDILFNAEASSDITGIRKKNGKFTVEESDPEMQELTMDKEFLRQISVSSGAIYSDINRSSRIVADINRINQNRHLEKSSRSEIRIWNNEYLLILLVLLFSIEWFLRKRNGMM